MCPCGAGSFCSPWAIFAPQAPAAHTHFLYYVVKPGTCGRHAFSSSYAQFLRDSKRYNAARAASGGRSPEHC